MRTRLFYALPLLLVAACEPLPPQVAPIPPPPPVVAPPPPPAPTETPDADFRKTAPTPGPDVTFVPPVIEETKLSNGIRVLFVERHDLPIISLRVVSDRGADQAGPGVGSFAGALWLSGTKKHTAFEINDGFNGLGAEYGSYADLDSSAVYLQVLSSKFGEALDLLGDAVRNPTFPQDELTHERSRRLTTLGQERDSPQRLASTTINDVLYPAKHPYHTNLLGTEAALRKISSSDLAAFHRGQIEPDHLTIVAAGDIAKASFIDQLEKTFGSWKGKSDKVKTLPDLAARDTKKKGDKADKGAKADKGPARVIIVDRPGATQSTVQVTMVGVPRSTKDFDAILVMNTILGGQFSSRLNLNLREKHGYTYGASTGFQMRRGPGPFSAGGAIVSEHTGDAVSEILQEIDRVRSAPVTDDELNDARNYLIRKLPALFETVSDTSSTLATIATYGLPLDEFASRPSRFKKVSADDVKRVASEHLDPPNMRVVIVGDAAKIKASLEQLNLGTIEVRQPPPAPAEADGKKGDHGKRGDGDHGKRGDGGGKRGDGDHGKRGDGDHGKRGDGGGGKKDGGKKN